MPQNRWGMNPTGPFQKVVMPWHRPETPAQHEENVRALERIDWGTGQGTRWATIVIAASDSTDLSKATADYVCGASNAATIINDVILGLEARTTPGRIVFLEGTYALSGPITVNLLSSHMIAFQGMGAAIREGSTPDTLFAGGSNIVFSLQGAGSDPAGGVIIENIGMTSSTASSSIDTRDMSLSLRNCSVTNTGGGWCLGQNNSTGSSHGTRLTDNYFIATGGATGVQVDVGPAADRPIIITDNIFEMSGAGNGILCQPNIGTIPTYIVAGNYIHGVAATAGSTGIKLAGSSTEDSIIAGNDIRLRAIGIEMSGGPHTVTGNHISVCTTGFKTGLSSSFLTLTGNSVISATVAFAIDNNAVRPTIIGNRAGNCTTAYTIAAGVTNAFVGYNDFGGAPGTNAGTNSTIVNDLPSGGASQFVLKKLSASSGDYDWALDPAIDAITAKGSILVGTAADALQSLVVGKNEALLTPDSTVTGGVKWGRRLFVQSTDPSLTITPDLGDVWIDTT